MASDTSATAGASSEPTHAFDRIEAGDDVRLAVALPAAGDEYRPDGRHVDDYLFMTVLDVGRFDDGDIREFTASHRERGRLRVRWHGSVTEVDEDAVNSIDEHSVGRHRGGVLRLNVDD